MASREAWLAERRAFITASDVAACMGLSPFKSREALMGEKLGTVPTFDIGRQPRVAAGRHLEDGVISWLLEDRGWKGHQNGPNLRVSPVLPFLAATVDAYVETPWGYEIAEIKNIKETSKPYWKAGQPKTQVPSTILRAGTDSNGRGWAAPLHYWVQLQVQLHCTNKDSGWIVGCVGGVDRVDMRFERDRGFEARMLEEVARFWHEKVSLELAFGDTPNQTTDEGVEDGRRDGNGTDIRAEDGGGSSPAQLPAEDGQQCPLQVQVCDGGSRQGEGEGCVGG